MIRKAVEKDISRIAEILIFTKRTAYRTIFKNDEVSFGKMQIVPLARKLFAEPQLLEGIYVFDEVFVRGLIQILPLDSNSVEVKALYIDPFFQHQGIGAELLNFAEGQAHQLKAQSLCLWVLEKNEAARTFYEQHGFLSTNEKTAEVGTEEFIVKYRKAL